MTWLAENLVCPRDHLPLARCHEVLACPHGHEYPCVDGVPVFLLEESDPTHPPAFAETLARAKARAAAQPEEPADGVVDSYVQREVAATNGILYVPLVGRLKEYPIPELRLEEGRGARLLDVGCNWGRWSVAAARRGYRVVGIDPSLEAVLAARRVARQLGVDAEYLVADARYLPFHDGCFDVVFSYSVLQHFAKEDARTALSEAGRVLREDGVAMVQMPNAFGVRSLYHQARRGLATHGRFDVRYWTPRELRAAFGSAIGPSELSVDGFFGLGIQRSDIPLLPRGYRAVVRMSETLRRVQRRVPGLIYAADSLYIRARRARAPSGA